MFDHVLVYVLREDVTTLQTEILFYSNTSLTEHMHTVNNVTEFDRATILNACTQMLRTTFITEFEY